MISVFFALLAHVAVAALPQTARADDAHVASGQQVQALRYRTAQSPATAGPWPFAGKWYGWQTLTSDAVSLSVIAANLSANPWNEEGLITVFAIGAVGFGLGPATIHALHGNWATAVLSPFIRLMTVALALRRELSRHSELCESECSDSVLPSIALVLLAPIFDAVFAWDARDVRPATPGLQVSALALRDGVFIGVSNSF